MILTFFQWMRGAPAGKLAFSCSLVLAVAFARASSYAEVSRRAEAASSLSELATVVSEAKFDFEDSELESAIQAFNATPTASGAQKLKAMLAVRALAEGSSARNGSIDPAKTAKQIKASPLYIETDQKQSSNWIGRAYKRIGELLGRIKQPKPKLPSVNPTLPSFQWLSALVWTILGAAVLFFLYLAIRHFRWTFKRSRKVGGLLEDDEPDRTADEWLEQADLLESQQRYREAVRCLYLASLARLDEAGVARFIRSQTNWEHYARIVRSPKRPSGLDLRPTTQAFDSIWYGFQVCGPPDVELFRHTYQSLCEQLRARKSA